MMNDIINTLRNKLTWMAAAGTGDVPAVTINKIPIDFEQFSGSNGIWAKVQFPKGTDYTSCLYIAEAGSEMAAHKHTSDEWAILLEGRCQVTTDEMQYFLEENKTAFLKKGVPHHFRFLEKTVVLCVWRPAFEDGNWEADFNES